MKLLKKGDIIIAAAVLLAAALFAIPKLTSSDKLTAEIYVDGVLERTVDLSDSENYSFSPKSKPNVTINVGDGAIWFSKADCKDKLCIKSGKLTSGGQTAACLPERVVVSVVSDKNKTDVMTY